MNPVAIRQALASLPRADNHQPGHEVALEQVYTVRGHRSALDPERPLVVGNRGMGKSFWAHALLSPSIRARAASEFRFSALERMEVTFGFNGSERFDEIAPTPQVIANAVAGGANPMSLWRAVLARAANRQLNRALAFPESFSGLVSWVEANPEAYAHLLTDLDDVLHKDGNRLLVLFDALDRLAPDWTTTRTLLQGLLQLALSTQSFRRIRIKIFLRLDQFSDPRLFGFPDASKIQNTHVSLQWDPWDLYGLLFQRLRSEPAFGELEQGLNQSSPLTVGAEPIVNAMAGEFMGANEKRGRVFTWLPTHLADALGQISPRTFLTAWRVAGEHNSALETAVDHHGILEGVREASRDRLAELEEDYPWVRDALAPLSGQSVPVERSQLEQTWATSKTVQRVVSRSKETDHPVLVPVDAAEQSNEGALLQALRAIGVVEIRQNGKVNVPDIFRVQAGIKRRGGVKPPRVVRRDDR